MWHLNLYTLHRRAGTDAGPLPGLWVGHAPKDAVRLRRQETLLLYLVQQGNAPLPPEQVSSLLAALAKRYFRQSGSTTKALRTVVQEVNARLVRRNQRLARDGRHAVWWLSMAVWRGPRVLLGFAGPLHGYVIGEQVTHVHDPALAGPGLGTQRAPRIYFASAEASPHGYLLLSPEPVSLAWEGLHLPPSRRPDPLLRRLLADPRPDLTVVLVQMRPGEGDNRIRPVPARWPMEVAASSAAGQPTEKEPQPERVSRSQAMPSGEQEAVSPPPSVTAGEAVPQAETASSKGEPFVEEPLSPADEALPVSEAAGGSTEPPPQVAASVETKEPHPQEPLHAPRVREGMGERPAFEAERSGRPARSPWRGAVAAALAWGAAVGPRVRQTVGDLLRPVKQVLRRTYPAVEEWVALPRSMMAFAAVVVPLVIVAFAVTVFLRRGRMEQMAYHYGLAQQFYQQAMAAPDDTSRYQALQNAASELQLALAFGQNDEVVALEAQVRGILDDMDRVERVPFEPLINGIPLQQREIVRVEVMSDTIFALDAVSGKVMRFHRVAKGYDYDPNFECGPGQYPGVEVGPLVDFVLVEPTLGKDYVVLGIDAQAHLVFCALRGSSYARALPLNVTLPSRQRVLRLLGEQLYLFVPAQKDVYVFDAQEDFSGTYYNLFAGQEPAWLDQVVDFVAQRGAFFFLLVDGQVVRCDQVSSTEPLNCTPLTYHDSRPGRTDGTVLADLRPVRLEVSVIQEPTLFMLESRGEAVLVLSFQLAYHHQIRPLETLDGPMRAFQITREPTPAGERWLYVAAGEQIYRAPIR